MQSYAYTESTVFEHSPNPDNGHAAGFERALLIEFALQRALLNLLRSPNTVLRSTLVFPKQFRLLADLAKAVHDSYAVPFTER